jgi:hypothetical protein
VRARCARGLQAPAGARGRWGAPGTSVSLVPVSGRRPRHLQPHGPIASTLRPRPGPLAWLSFLALPFALAWSPLFTLPSLPLTPRSPSRQHSHLFLRGPSSRRLPRGPRWGWGVMLRTPRAGSAPRRARGPPLPWPRGRGRQVSAPSLPR